MLHDALMLHGEASEASVRVRQFVCVISCASVRVLLAVVTFVTAPLNVEISHEMQVLWLCFVFMLIRVLEFHL